MAGLLVLSEADVHRVLDLDELAESLRTALMALSAGSVSVPPRIGARSPGGLLAAMPGYVDGVGLAAKLVSVYPHNPERGRPAHQAIIAVFDEETGAPRAVMGATLITAMRTAMTSALAARALARPQSATLAVIGSGVQADAHMAALTRLLDLTDIRVASRNNSRASQLAGRYPKARAVDTVMEAVDGADVVCCCTDAAEPVVRNEWIGPGTHIGSVGSGAELPDGLIRRARVFVESRAATAPPPAGALELQGVDAAELEEIGSVLAGRSAGRATVDEITVFKSTGHATEDVAAAAVVLRAADRAGLGTTVSM
ncbi:MAG: ornithine cyclodeaminase family protein [Acidimicrobiales bacterium]